MIERDIVRARCCVASGGDSDDGGCGGGGCRSFAHTFVKSLTIPNQELAATFASLCAFSTLRIVSRPTRQLLMRVLTQFRASTNALVRLAERDNADDIGRASQ